jgi:hypothetical protein
MDQFSWVRLHGRQGQGYWPTIHILAQWGNGANHGMSHGLWLADDAHVQYGGILHGNDACRISATLR